MKKKIFLFLLTILLVFEITGCSCSRKVEPEQKLADDEVIVNDTLYKLDQDESGYGITYKIATNFRKWDSGNALNYFGRIGDTNESNFVIRVFYYKNKTIDYAIKDTTENKFDSKEEVEINGQKYTKVHFENYNGANTYLFYYKHNKDVYAYCFTANEEIERLENIFLSQVIYK